MIHVLLLQTNAKQRTDICDVNYALNQFIGSCMNYTERKIIAMVIKIVEIFLINNDGKSNNFPSIDLI